MRQAMRTLTLAVLLVFVISLTAKADIVGLWRFEEGSGDVAHDTSGHNHNGGLWAIDDPGAGIDSNNPTWIARVATGSQYALEFGTPTSGIPGPGNPDRNWNYVYVDYNSVLENLGTQWTIACWYQQYTNNSTINYGGGGGYQRIISCPSYEIELGTSGDPTDYFWPYDSAVWEFAIAASQPLNQWHHMALTYDGTTFTKYIDGSSVFTNSVSGQPLPNVWDTWEYLRFGAQTDPIKDLFVGALDDIAIFNECLDSGKIAQIRDGSFAGPWQTVSYESTNPVTYLYDWTFIVQRNTIPLNLGQKRTGGTGVPSWNWVMQGTLDNNDYYGLVNAGLIDGNATSVEYAAYTTVGDQITQVSAWKPIRQDTKYDFRARIAGENAVGNIIGVRFYAIDPNDYNVATLLADISKTITTNATWYDINTTFTAGATHELKRFKAVCYVETGSGNGRGSAFGWFDSVRIDANAFFSCQALRNYGINLPDDFTGDCLVNFKDFGYFAADWLAGSNPEPMANATELLGNNDFYADFNRCPNAGDSNGGNPTGWQLVPASSDKNVAGVWNVSNMGEVHNAPVAQPAGGTVAAFIDPNHELRQTISTPAIVNGQTYYLSAMLGGVQWSYYHTLRVIYEYVDNPTTPTVITEIARQEYVLPERTVWRRFCTAWTATPASAGKYFRVRAVYVPPDPLVAEPNGWGLIGNISVNTAKPAYWQRTNLITNGDFEDYSNLPQGTLGDEEGWINLFTYNGYTYFAGIPSEWPVGWTFEDSLEDEGGLQCMLWAPSPQPAHGRISLWLGVGPVPPTFTAKIDQKVTSETIQNGQTYYLDFIGSISAASFNNGTWIWPDPDPNLVVELYWLAPGVNNIYGPGQGTSWDLILSLKKPVDNSLGSSGGHWQKANTSWTAGPSMAGRSFFVCAYRDGASYTTFEEIFLSKEPPQTIQGFTCADQKANFGGLDTDLNGDCDVDIYDVSVFVEEWVSCNDPVLCP